ncbi:FtsX-like permease family protein [Bacteroides sp.]|uniref:ABC transporter permease n=1 Tax=Bacteroides sp. TaxID=29523 RepID=UPI0023CF1078|nr:FtsX-like permease family protein [Bacteroides sp.]MDE6216744.1 ABC transporter permease [Bacteroides sp.]
MTLFATLKIIVRSWWRNKVFFLISVLSLTVGLACTNLLFTYFVHDYNFESGNRNKDRIFCLQQDDPLQEGSKATYVSAGIPSVLKEKYAEVTDYLRLSSYDVQYCRYQENVFREARLICADTTMQHFFTYQSFAGCLKQALEQPGKVALSEAFARKVFGDKNPLGELLEVKTAMDGVKRYEVTAVLKPRPQSLLRFEMLTGMDAHFFGGLTFLQLAPHTSPRQLAEKINRDKVPTLMPGETKYYVEPLSALYFVTPGNSPRRSLSYINQSNMQLLYISLTSALLILIIACCNYTNMSLSRVLQQLKMIHVEKLMGSRKKDIRLQLFGDAFLTVLLAFVLSLLAISDCLSFFNRLLASHLDIPFFFSMQMLPFLLLFVLIMAIVPACYISRKLSALSFSEYKTLQAGKRKQRFVSCLVVLQFMISMGLIYATLTANRQISLINEHAACYENLIEIGASNASPSVAPLKDELEKQGQGIQSMSLSGGPVLSSWIQELAIKQPDGTEKKSHLVMLSGDTDVVSTMGLQQLSGDSPQQLVEKYPYPVLVNESYVRNLVPSGVNPIGHLMAEFAMADSIYTIGGVVKDFSTGSLEAEVNPCMIHVASADKMSRSDYLHIRLEPERRQETLRRIGQVWEKVNEGSVFQYTDLHREFMKRNDKVCSLSKMLIGYSLIGLALTCFGLFGISWYATRQRIREISIRKIHGATAWHIIWLFCKPFCLQIAVAYLLAIPTVYGLMFRWREQFAYKADWTITDFLLPLMIVVGISAITIGLQGYLLNKVNPIESIKTE